MKQKGFGKLIGTSKDLTYYKRGKEYLAKKKSEPNKEALKSGANYARTRENQAEFGESSRFGKMIRVGFADYTPRSSGRFTAFCRWLLGAGDLLSERGKRRFVNIPLVHLKALEGFSFSKNGVHGFSSSSFAMIRFESSFSGNAGVFKATKTALMSGHPSFAPKSTTHWGYFGVAGVFDLEKLELVEMIDIHQVSFVPFLLTRYVADYAHEVPFQLSAPLGPNEMLVVVCGVGFLTFTNGVYYPVYYKQRHYFDNILSVYRGV